MRIILVFTYAAAVCLSSATDVSSSSGLLDASSVNASQIYKPHGHCPCNKENPCVKGARGEEQSCTARINYAGSSAGCVQVTEGSWTADLKSIYNVAPGVCMCSEDTLDQTIPENAKEVCAVAEPHEHPPLHLTGSSGIKLGNDASLTVSGGATLHLSDASAVNLGARASLGMRDRVSVSLGRSSHLTLGDNYVLSLGGESSLSLGDGSSIALGNVPPSLRSDNSAGAESAMAEGSATDSGFLGFLTPAKSHVTHLFGDQPEIADAPTIAPTTFILTQSPTVTPTAATADTDSCPCPTSVPCVNLARKQCTYPINAQGSRTNCTTFGTESEGTWTQQLLAEHKNDNEMCFCPADFLSLALQPNYDAICGDPVESKTVSNLQKSKPKGSYKGDHKRRLTAIAYKTNQPSSHNFQATIAATSALLCLAGISILALFRLRSWKQGAKTMIPIHNNDNAHVHADGQCVV